MNTWLRTGEAAAYLGVSSVTLWRWTVAGIVPKNDLLPTGSRVRYASWWVAEKTGP